MHAGAPARLTSFARFAKPLTTALAGSTLSLPQASPADATTNFLGKNVGANPFSTCNQAFSFFGTAVANDGSDKTDYLEHFDQYAASASGGAPYTKWREVHVDVGKALADGKWSDKVDINIYAQSIVRGKYLALSGRRHRRLRCCLLRRTQRRRLAA